MPKSEEEHKALSKFDRMIRDLTPDQATGLPNWIAANYIPADGDEDDEDTMPQ